MRDRGYTAIEAKIEANRCLMCADAPCSCDCPAGVDARGFIRKIRFDNLEGAVRLIKKCNVLAASCSRICPTGDLCGKGCTVKGLSHPIDVAGLQRFVMDWERETGMIEPLPSKKDGARVAVVGSGPAGLACAAELSVRGHIVTVFESDTVFGGMLRQCIPSFRLPPEVMDFEIEFIKKLGVEFTGGMEISDPKTLLAQGFKAVFIATGLPKSSHLELINANKPQVYEALDVLKKAKKGSLPELGKRVVVIGGGDTALDSARISKKAGAECFILYRRTQKEMPAYPEEINAAWNDGVEFYFRTIVRSVVGDDNVKGVRCVRIKWHEKVVGMLHGYDVEGTEFLIACDSVVLATGQGPSSVFGLRATPKGFIATDKDSPVTSETGIFAGGDVASGGGTAARAVGHGRLAAVVIDKYIKEA